MLEVHLAAHVFDTAIALEHFWQGQVYSVLPLATILSNPFYKNSSNDGHIDDHIDQ